MYYPSTDRRAAALSEWLNGRLGLEVHRIEPASSDASFRRYFRVTHADGGGIVMDAPPDKEATEPFVRIAGMLKAAGIHAPTIYRQNREQGFLFLEDLGSSCFLDVLNDDNADDLYRSALDSLFKLQTDIAVDSCGLPTYDHALLARELGIFYEWFLEKLLGIVLPESIKLSLDAALIDSALAQPRVCVHRDYHSRNLMWLENDSPGVIDFQDAVIGPVTYDLVSLLRDCYVRWPRSRVSHWSRDYYRRLVDAGVLSVDFAKFTHWFDWMGLQRHLKAIGIFARLHLRDNKSGYLADIPRTMSYVADVCAHYPELAEFDGFLRRQVLPVYQAKL